MFKKIKKYYSIEPTERKILNRTFFWLIYAFILVRFIPLRWFSSCLGDFNRETEIKLDDKQIHLINLFRKNLRRLKKALPWQVKCLEEAIAGKKVLINYDIKTILYLGVAKEGEQNLKAHAWLKIGDQFITGEQGHQNYTVVGFYS